MRELPDAVNVKTATPFLGGVPADGTVDEDHSAFRSLMPPPVLHSR
jgi:hypothetical protein